MHCTVIFQSGLVDIDIKAVIALHLKRGLDPIGRKWGLGVIRAEGCLEAAGDFAEPALGVLVLLGIEVSRNPVRSVVTSHPELCKFFFDNEISKRRLLRELISETETVIKKTESEHEPLIALCQFHGHLIVVVPDAALLAPYRSPGLVNTLIVNRENFETGIEHI